jgi:peptide/nickel transport system substrate-binding protein
MNILRRRQWLALFRALQVRDRFLVLFFAVVGIGALLFWLGALYVTSTKSVPDFGGEYTEGSVSQPRYINPILSQTSEADADISALVYSGLFGYDAEGNLTKRLLDDYTVSDDGRTYTLTLKQGVKWHDGEELTADDVLFSISAIQNPAYKSPLRSNWLSVEATSVDRYTVMLTLKKAYFGFLESLTVGILPKHIWENITPENFLLADYNLSPIGSGPYRFYDSDKDSSGNMLSYELRSFKDYFTGAPYIEKIVFHFYPDETSLLDAYNRKEVLGMNSVTPENFAALEEYKSARIHEIAVPRIFAVFFNITKNAALANSEVRRALAYATDREAIIHEVLFGKGVPAETALLPFMDGYANDIDFARFDEGRANALLDEGNWKRGDDGIRAKNGTVLQFELMVPDWPELTRTAEILKEQWSRVGANVMVTALSASDLQANAIRPREYQALLFGEAAMLHSDPYSFWHSSQKRDPGRNLSVFDNKDVDEVLLALRETINPEQRAASYHTFQETLAQENPAVFLYSPTYLYVVNSVVKGIGVSRINVPADRLSTVKDWYMDTKRVKK